MDKQDAGNELDPKLRKKRILVGGVIIAICLIILGAFLFHRFAAKQPAPAEDIGSGIGVMDFAQVMEAHPDYEKLQELYRQRDVLLRDIEISSNQEPFKAPEGDIRAFQSEAKQKQMTQMVAMHGQIEEKLKTAESEYRKKTRPAYEQEKKSIDDVYLNEILNIRINLDNAKSMRLSENEIKRLNSRLNEIQMIRGEKQYQLAAAYEDSVREYMQGIIAESNESLKSYGAQLEAEHQKDMEQRFGIAQERNEDEMQKQMEESGAFAQRLLQKKSSLTTVEDNIHMLEEHILKDISGRAAKLAIMHHLTVILSNPALNLKGFIYEQLKVGSWSERYTPVISIDTMDLTDEMLDEMKEISNSR